MRRSTSRCRKSRLVERWLRRDRLPYTLSTFAMLVAISCRLSHPPTEDGGGAKRVNRTVSPAPAAASSAVPPSPPESQQAPLTGSTRGEVTLVVTGSSRPLGTAALDACGNPEASSPLQLLLPLASRFGTHDVSLSVTPGPNETIAASVDQFAVTQRPASPLFAALRAAICSGADMNRDATARAVDAESVLGLIAALERIAPDCERVEVVARGFVCHLPSVDPELARQELVGIQTTMIRRWSRQPYLLARRLAVGVTLAEALAAPDVARALDGFCKLIGSALPAELPATLGSRRWQAAVCAPTGVAARLDAARFGLAKTVAEVDVMRQLFESTSRLGHLAVKIPGKTLPGNRVLVSLTPDVDVAENLAKATGLLRLGGDAVPADAADMSDAVPRACWHPVYAESPALMRLAADLTLAGDADLAACVAPPTHGPAPERYFAESITSETEFVVSNGRAKTLRLPVGHYHYTLRTLPEDPGAWDDASQVAPQATGRVAWQDRRPYAVISTW